MATKTTYCQCGAMIKLTVDNIKVLDGVMAIWWREHQGDGHGPATRQQALAGRAREEALGDDTLLTVDMSAVDEMMARRERAQDGA